VILTTSSSVYHQKPLHCRDIFFFTSLKKQVCHLHRPTLLHRIHQRKKGTGRHIQVRTVRRSCKHWIQKVASPPPPPGEAVPYSWRRSDGPYIDSPTSSSPLPSTQLPAGQEPNVASPPKSLGTDHLDADTRLNHPPAEHVFDPFPRDPGEFQILNSKKSTPPPNPQPAVRHPSSSSTTT
jgi:hypothetical protein